VKWTKKVPTQCGWYLHQGPKAYDQESSPIRLSYFWQLDIDMAPDYPPKGPWYMGPLPKPKPQKETP
jgi:hypothetical protein